MAASGPATNAVLVERLANIEVLMREIKGVIEDMDSRLGDVEKSTGRCQALSGERVERNQDRFVRIEARLEKLETGMIELMTTNKILRWLLGVVTAVLIALVGAIATGSLGIVVQ